MTTQFEAERSSLEVLHTCELKELWEKMATTFREKKESQSLGTVKNNAAISNAHLQECQLEHFSLVDMLLNYANQSKVLLPELAQ